MFPFQWTCFSSRIISVCVEFCIMLFVLKIGEPQSGWLPLRLRCDNPVKMTRTYLDRRQLRVSCGLGTCGPRRSACANSGLQLGCQSSWTSSLLVANKNFRFVLPIHSIRCELDHRHFSFSRAPLVTCSTMHTGNGSYCGNPDGHPKRIGST